jgi:hypothetical protein
MDDLEYTFQLRWQADQRAIKRWREATGRTLVQPDHVDLVIWLLEQIDRLEAENLDIKNELAHMRESEAIQDRAALIENVKALEVMLKEKK